jgi:hypothetical protein
VMPLSPPPPFPCHHSHEQCLVSVGVQLACQAAPHNR